VSGTAVGAAVSGHDYQFLLVWIAAVQTLDPKKDVTRVVFETADKTNVDDLQVVRAASPTTYHQVKFSVEPYGNALTSDWFTTSSRPKGTSPLQKFCASFEQIGGNPELYLDTNRAIDPSDALLTRIRGHDGALGPRLAGVTPASEAGRTLAAWAQHVSMSEQELLAMLNHLYIRAGQEPFTALREGAAGLQMRVTGMRGESNAVDLGIATIRDLVKQGPGTLTPEDVRQIADDRALWATDPESSLLIEQVKGYSWREIPTAAVDWRPFFADNVDGQRRRLAPEYTWDGDLRRKLQNAVVAIHAAGIRRVRVTGSPRVSGWFQAGFELRHVGGHEVIGTAGADSWASDSERGEAEIHVRSAVDVSQGDDLAVALSVAQMALPLAETYIRDAALPVEELIELTVDGAPNRQLIRGAEHARAIADGFYYEIAARHQGRNLHVFAAIPGALALLLGHAWNRLPTTRLYDDRGPQPTDGPGYDPTFLLASS
jgi:SMODS-associated and fused to various effectors sensor domain